MKKPDDIRMLQITVNGNFSFYEHLVGVLSIRLHRHFIISHIAEAPVDGARTATAHLLVGDLDQFRKSFLGDNQGYVA